MKKLYFFPIALFLCISAMAQTGWISVDSDLDPNRNVGQISVGMNNPDALWALAVDDGGAIVDEYTVSTDAGLTWTQGYFNDGDGLSQLFAIDENTCWAVFNTGADQGLYKTEDGGTTWVKKGTDVYGSGSFANVIHFFNDNDGFAQGDPVGGYYELYTTTDGGETWTRVPEADIPPPTSGEYGITGNYCAVGDNIWWGTNKGRIYYSTDKGYTWEVSLTAFGETQVVAPEFSDAMNGIAFRSYLDMGIEPELNVTTDGGATWTSLIVNGTMYARYIKYVPGTTGTYVGSSSEPDANGISYSHDGGQTWTILNGGYDFGATAWLNDSTGWAGTYALADLSTGGMYIYDGEPLVPAAPVSGFEADFTAIAIDDYVTFTDLSTGSPTSWSWEFEGGTPGTSYLQSPPPIQYTESGSWDVSLTTSNSYGSDTKTMEDYIVVGGVGIGENETATVTMYPNPVTDYLKVNSTNIIREISIINMSGQTVLKREVGSKSLNLDLQSLKSGIYHIRISIADGFINKRIVVK